MSAQATAAKPQPWKSQLGAGSSIPNLFVNAIRHETLRKYSSQYVGLPDADVLQFSEPATFRYAHQSSPLWQEMHAGLITTGRLNGALGLGRPGGRRRGGSSPEVAAGLASAWGQALDTPWQPAQHLSQSPLDTGATFTSNGPLAQHLSHNELQRRRLFNSKAPEGSVRCAEEMWGPEGEADKRRVCEILALQGSLACRLYWGNVQEAASLHALAQVFPHSVLEEVGLLSVDLSSLPPAWDLSPDELPGLGASPDALIRHHLPIPWAAIEDARARIAVRQGVPVGLGQSQSAQGGGTSHVSSGSGNTGAPIPAVVLPGGPPSPPEVSVQAAAVLEAVCLLHGALANLLTSPPGEQGNASTSTPQPQVAAAAAAVAIGVLPLHEDINSQVVSWLASVIAGSAASFTEAVQPQQQPLTETNSSNSRQSSGSPPITQSSSSAAAGADSPQRTQSGVGVVRRPSDPGSSSGGNPSSTLKGAGGGGGAAPVHVDKQGVAWVAWREVVETKNHCPFTIQAVRKARKGRLMVLTTVSDSGPMEKPRPQWSPQLQLHSLAARTSTALLVSRSLKGMRVFRVQRDDDFQLLLLRTLRHLHVGFASRGELPPGDVFRRPEIRIQHKALISATYAVSSSAQLVAEQPGPGLPGGLERAAGADANSLWTVSRG